MISKYIKSAILCVDKSEVIINKDNNECYKAWNEGKEDDKWLIPINVLKATYAEVEVKEKVVSDDTLDIMLGE